LRIKATLKQKNTRFLTTMFRCKVWLNGLRWQWSRCILSHFLPQTF